MSLLLKAFPHGRPYHRAHLHARALVTVALTLVAMVLALLPLASPATAAPSPQNQNQQNENQKQARPHDTAKQKKKPKPKPKPKPKKAVGQPPRSYVPPATSFFSFPNRSKAERLAIRMRVLKTINSTWGGRRTSIGTPRPENGTIRIATWSFDDWDIARALVAARKRGVSVQVVAAKAANKDHQAWHWLRKRLGGKLYRSGYPATRDTVSFARVCKGACRGPGGTAHSKYFLFDDVGARHKRKVTFQTSSNLTYMAYQGQWNQAQISHSTRVYDDFLAVFRQTRLTRPVARPYHVAAFGQVVNYFFPRPRATVAQDPVMHILNATRCLGATTPGLGGRTKIRVAQYAIYGDRGVWISKKLRALWKAGCDVSIIYSVSSRPVLAILRNPAGRGPIPMRQSVVTDYYGNFAKYNHSKWMTIVGSWGPTRDSFQTFSGSANWANLAFGDDEQMQRISSVREAMRHNAAFKKTWRQGSSSEPAYGRVATFGRGASAGLSRAALLRGVPMDEPAFGEGVYRYMTRD